MSAPAPFSAPAPAPFSAPAPAPASAPVPAPAPVPVSMTSPIEDGVMFRINDECYKGTLEQSLNALGYSAKIGMTTVGIAIALICVLLFAYIVTTTPSAVPKVIAVCCLCSLIGGVVDYFTTKSDLESLKKSTKLSSCPAPQPAMSL